MPSDTSVCKYALTKARNEPSHDSRVTLWAWEIGNGLDFWGLIANMLFFRSELQIVINGSSSKPPHYEENK